jgi:hypothetical protein
MRRSRIALVTLIVGLFLMLAPLAVGASSVATAPTPTTSSATYYSMYYTDCMYYYNDINYCCWYGIYPNYSQCYRYVPGWYATRP